MATAKTKLHFSRFEFKYVLPKDMRDEVESELQHFVELDDMEAEIRSHRTLDFADIHREDCAAQFIRQLGARQHAEIGSDQGTGHILLQIRCNPQCQRIHLDRLQKERHALDQRQQDNQRRRHPDHLGSAAISKGVKDMARQQGIGRRRCRHNRHQHQCAN